MANLALTKSKHLLPFTAVLRAHQVNVHHLLRMANLPLTCLDDPDTLIPVVCEGAFRELAAQKTGSPNISLEACRDLEVENLGEFGRALLMEPTLHASLHKMREIVASETSNLTIELRPQSNGDLWFGQRMGIGDWHNRLYVTIWMLKVVRLANPEWSPAEILISSKAIRHRFEAVEMLGSTASFQQNDTGFIVPASMLARPVTKKVVTGIDMDVEQVNLYSNAPPGSYAAALKQMIRSYTDDCWLHIEQASDVTHTSVRTIQRRLSAEQKTYSNIIQEVRSEMAGALLENTDAAISEIANQLGYKNQSHFTRAFYRWAKVSPSQFRQQRSLRY